MNCNWLFVRKGHLLFEENHDKVYFLMHKYGQNAQEIAMGCEKMETFHIQNTASSTARRMGAALAPPPPYSSTTATAICGSSAGAYPMSTELT